MRGTGEEIERKNMRRLECKLRDEAAVIRLREWIELGEWPPPALHLFYDNVGARERGTQREDLTFNIYPVPKNK